MIARALLAVASVVVAVVAVVAGVTVVAGPARADAVPPPPTDCLPGTQPETCHGGPHCRPKLCTSDADCGDLGPCRSQKVCVDEIACGGLRPADAPPPPRFTVVRGECSESCGRCETLAFCGAKPSSILGLFGCGGAGDAGTGVGLALSLLAVMVLRGRRAGRRASGLAWVVPLALAGALAPATARADRVPVQPEACPEGARPATCHGGPYCAIVACDAATPCPAGERCAEVEGCFRQLQCAGDVNPEDLPKYLRWSLDGPCDSGHACCAKRSMCVPGAAPTPVVPATSTGATPAPARSACAGGGADAGVGLGLIAGGLALLRGRRARRRAETCG